MLCNSGGIPHYIAVLRAHQVNSRQFCLQGGGTSGSHIVHVYVDYRALLDAPCLALSDTVTQDILDDISTNLMMGAPVTVVATLSHRHNIFIDVQTKTDDIPYRERLGLNC